MSQPNSATTVYCDGILQKRGKGSYPLSTLRFQERFCRLTQTSLEYYSTKGKDFKPGPGDFPNGSFPVNNIQIVEEVPQELFKKEFCFQVGNQDEVMYFATFSNEERVKWMEEFRQASKNNNNRMLEHYHTGIYTRSLPSVYSSWNCCRKSDRTAVGCQKTLSVFIPQQLSPIIEVDEDTGRSLDCRNDTRYVRSGSSGIVASVESTSTLVSEQSNRESSFRSRVPTTESGFDETPKLAPRSIPRKDMMYSPTATFAVPNTHPPLSSESKFSSTATVHVMLDSDCTSLSSHPITALAFSNTNKLVSGSETSYIQIWDVPDLTFECSVKTTGATSSLSTWNDFLAIGSNFVQIVDMNDINSFTADEETVPSPLMQLVAFGPQGHFATVNSESKTVKVWPPPKEPISEPLWTSGATLDSFKGSIESLAISSNEDQPWIAVGIVSELESCVHLLNWKERVQFHFVLFPDLGGTKNGALCILFSHSAQNIAAGCGNLIKIWEVNPRTVISVTLYKTGAIHSLCYSPDDAHLAVGMSTGEVVVYDPWSGNPIFTLEGPQESRTPATAIAFSNDGTFFAAGYYNGNIQLWKTNTSARPYEYLGSQSIYCPTESVKRVFCNDLPLIGRVEDEIQSREEEYIMEFLDYKIVIPANATREGRKIPFQTGEMPLGPVGPFKFPPNTKPVSSIVWFHSNKMSDLQKPINIVLSHCLNYTSKDDLKRLVFMKADDDFKINEMGEKEFHFHRVRAEEREGEPLFTKDDGTLTTRYNCWYAICEQLYKVPREEIDRTRYCLTQAVPKHMTEGEYEIRFILSYFLKSCMKVIDVQYNGTHKVTHKTITFSAQGPNPCIRAEFKRDLPKGWIVTCPSGRSINVNDVYFLEKDQKELELALEYRQYPPNIVLDAHGGEATGDAVLDVILIGADQELKLDVFLEKAGPLAVAEPVLPMDAAKSLSVCSSYGITTSTQTPIPCSEGNDDPTKGQYYPHQYISSLSPELQQPPTQQVPFLTPYEKHKTHSNGLSSSSPAQSMEVDPTVDPVEETYIPGHQNGNSKYD